MSYHYTCTKFVPIVIKDYSTLVGFCEALDFVKSSFKDSYNVKNLELVKNNLTIYHNAISSLSSFRFNSICFLDIDIDEYSIDSVEQKLKDYYTDYVMAKKQIPMDEKTLPIWVESALSFDCPHCGINHTFIDTEEIPQTDYHCDNCGNILIDYTNKHDFEFSYLGNDKRRIAFSVLEGKIIKEVTNSF